MLFAILSPLYLAATVYFIYETFKWIDALSLATTGKGRLSKAAKILSGIVIGIGTFSPAAALLIPADISKDIFPGLWLFRRILKTLGNYHLGIFIYVGLAFAVIWLIRLFERRVLRKQGYTKEEIKSKWFSRKHAIQGLCTVAGIAVIVTIGVLGAHRLVVKNYDITVTKSSENIDDMRIVLISDLHIGINTLNRHVEEMVDLINEQNPDLVVIAGDIFDNEYTALEDPEETARLLKSIKSKYGVYAVYGNHDVEELLIGGFTFGHKRGSSKEMDNLLKKADIKLLLDEGVMIDDSIYLYGRLDYSKLAEGVSRRKTPKEITEGINRDIPIIVIDHQPRELDELSEAGVDIDLCGHTHDGQFFPMNITSRLLVWENSAGYLQRGNLHNIVSAGVGLYGPNMRVGTRPDICVIDVHFRKMQ